MTYTAMSWADMTEEEEFTMALENYALTDEAELAMYMFALNSSH